VSAFAGNIALLSPDRLADEHLIPSPPDPVPGDGRAVDHEAIGRSKAALLRVAWDRFRGGHGPGGLPAEFEAYCDRERGWLDDYALFQAIRDALGGAGLADWPADLRARNPVAVAALEAKLASEVRMHRFGQFLFDRQLADLRRVCGECRVRLIGDAPIFVSADSADVWANPDQFLLDDQFRPTVVAGVPPDYFSPTGQHWGNPLYDWDRMAATGYSWWAARLKRLFGQSDLVRLDHFRGFAAAWHIPAGDPDATRGEWVPGPGERLFEALTASLGRLPLVAEDLGLITPDVHALRERFGYPGMRVLQFMLGGPDNPYWPHFYDRNTVAYTGTHDNDTTAGWYARLGDDDKRRLARYLGREVGSPAWDLIRLAWASVADLAIAPLQDVLELGTEARMNVPGVATGNWGWRFTPDQIRPGQFERLAELTEVYHRNPFGITAADRGRNW
jgi:4-alpha-glucanotransferase